MEIDFRKGLWKGNLPAIIMYSTYGSIQFYTATEVLKIIKLHGKLITKKEISSEVSSFFCGALAGGVATSATYPLDLLRTRLAAQGQQKVYNGLNDAIKKIYVDEGIFGFYRGLGPTLLQIVPNMGILFGAHSFFKRLYSKLEFQLNPRGQNTDRVKEFVCGGMAGVFSKTIVMPFDVVKKRMQVQGPNRNNYVVGSVPLYPRKFFGTAKMIVVAEGVLGLYKGWIPSLVKSAPSSAVTFL
ncbi:mitochondrial thiamine pyrophosphate transporter, partial [Nowakowskiella sp. JEL0078]